MKLVRPSYEIIEQGPGLQGIYDIIERCGKTSYKSEVWGDSQEVCGKQGQGASRCGIGVRYGVFETFSITI